MLYAEENVLILTGTLVGMSFYFQFQINVLSNEIKHLDNCFALFQTIYQLKLQLSNHLDYTAYKVHKHIYNNKECLLYNTTDINSYTFSFVSYLEKVKF